MMPSWLLPAFTASMIALLAAPASAKGGEADMLETMREFADITSGQPVGDGGPADKLVYFARVRGEIGVIAIQALAPGGALGEPIDGAFAIMRTRAATAKGNKAPEPADFDYVLRKGVQLFIVGEWSDPPAVWQIVRQSGQVRWREIGADSKAGPWQAAPAVASP